MKKAVAACVVVAALSAQAASAKTLEEILKEKGVITEEDYKAVTKSPLVRYQLGDGFTLASADEKFKLSLGGRLQVRFTYNDLDDKVANDTQEFRMRRIKLWTRGYAYTKDLGYNVQWDFASIVNGSPFEFGYLDYRLIDEVQLQVGQAKVHFGRQWLNSSGAQEFVDRSFASDFFRPGYDTGVKLHGDVMKGLVTYEAGVYGGAGQNTPRAASTNYAVAARATVNPFGKMAYSEADVDFSTKPLLSVGADYYTNGLKATRSGAPASTAFETNNVTIAGNGWLGKVALGTASPFVTQNIDFEVMGVDAAFKWMGLFAEGEFFTANTEGQLTKSFVHGRGFFAQAGYCIIPKTFEAAVRYSYVDPSHVVPGDQRSDVQGALSWYINKHNLKLQGDVSSVHSQPKFNNTATATDDMVYRLQAQIIF